MDEDAQGDTRFALIVRPRPTTRPKPQTLDDTLQGNIF